MVINQENGLGHAKLDPPRGELDNKGRLWIELMSVELPPRLARSAHVIVLGNEKGGSGKSTTCMHIAIGLLQAGQRVATIDLDSRQQGLTHYVENRRAWSKRNNLGLAIPTHRWIARSEKSRTADNEAAEFAGFAEAINAVEHCHDFILIDTPATDSYLMRLAHSMADTLVTPVNDSFIDFDVLGTLDPETFAVVGISHYAEMVRQARRQRRSADGGAIDWIVARNRLMPDARHDPLIAACLDELSARLGIRITDGLAQRVAYREFFPRGLTAIDLIDEKTLGVCPNLSHLMARKEVRELIEALRLPLDERGRRRAAARAEWLSAPTRPLETHGILAE
jgi:chromosome partitioning protein